MPIARLQKSFIGAYRLFAFGALFAILFAVVSYVATLGFYLTSTSWAVPTILSPSSDAVVRFRVEFLRARQALATAEIELREARYATQALRDNRDRLNSLGRNVDRAIATERRAEHRAAGQILHLVNARQELAISMEQAGKNAAQLADEIDRDLALGLLTATDAARQRIQLAQLKSMALSNRSETVLLANRASELSRSATTLGRAPDKAASSQAIAILARSAELQLKVAEIETELLKASDRERVARKARAEISDLLSNLEMSPYYAVVNAKKPILFAFVPYENEQQAVVGAPVYTCLLQMIGCYNVGTITKIHHVEQIVKHPLYRTEIRGFLIEMNLGDRDAAKSKVVFLGGRPLFI